MAAKSFQEEVGEELAGKAMMWGPAVAGGLALGPVGALVGAIVSVVIVASGSSAFRESEDRSKQELRAHVHASALIVSRHETTIPPP